MRKRKGEMEGRRECSICVCMFRCVYMWKFAVCFCLDFRAMPIEVSTHIMSAIGEAREVYLFIYFF